MSQYIPTTWRHVRPGARLVIKGVEWTLVSRDPWVLESPVYGRREGAPHSLDAAVQVREPADHPGITLAQAMATVEKILGGTIVDTEIV